MLLNCEFNPIQCTSEVFKNLTAQEGFLYFVTDTKQLFLGRDGKMIDMCGGIGLVYGTKNIEYENTGQKPDPNVIFYLHEIESGEYPKVSDLILNIDGCFYRVNSIDKENSEIMTERLTLQGSGTGGGGGSSDGPSTGGGFSVTHVGGKTRYFSSEAPKAEIGFLTYGDSSNFISRVACFLGNETEPFIEEDGLSYPIEQPYYIDLVKHLNKFNQFGKRVTVYVYDKYGAERSLFFTVYTIELNMETAEPNLIGIDSNTFKYICDVSGGSTLDSRILYYDIYKEDNSVKPVLSYEFVLESNQGEGIQKNIDVSELPQDNYILKIQAKGISGSTEVWSNVLTHKIVRYDPDANKPILGVHIPEKTEQHTEIPIQYLLVEQDTNSQYTLNIYLDKVNDQSKPVSQEIIKAKVLDSYPLLFEEQGSYVLSLEIPELGIVYTKTLNITKYTGQLPVINTNRDDLEVYLNPRGKTNNSLDKSTWTSYVGNEQAVLNNFYYDTINGWFMDDEGAPYLKVSQGATVSMPNYRPFKSDAMSNRMGATIEVDFKVSGVTDYDAQLIRCISRNANKVIQCGFAITGNKAMLYTSRMNGTNDINPVNISIVENKRIRLTFVIEPRSAHEFPMIYTYLNGKLSSVVAYESTETFIDSADIPAKLMIDSTSGQVDIYGIRFYTTALPESVIINNYQAALATLQERQASYDSNNILDIKGDILFEAIESEQYPLNIPYVKITGGYGCSKSFLMNKEGDDTFELPVGKKDYRLIDIEIHYPKNELFKGYGETDASGNPTYMFSERCVFDDADLNVTNGFGQTPNSGAMMYAQGTSSLEYPVKNLRVKFKTKKIKVRPTMDPVNLICFKADYMESSGSHNTGASNFIDTAYQYIPNNDGTTGIQTPGQAYYSGRDIVTCIKGHPCVIFWSPTGEQGSYQYIGKYNLNLDKATPEPFGFRYDTAEDVLEGDAEKVKFGYELDKDGNLVLETVVDEDGKSKTVKKNAIYCFEFLDNAVKVCNFIADTEDKELKATNYEETWYNTYVDGEDTLPGWTKGFESRFPEDKVGMHDADCLYEVAKWINELYRLRLAEEAQGKKPSDITNIYSYTEATTFDAGANYYRQVEGDETSTDGYVPAWPNETDFGEKTYYTRKLESSRFGMDSLERFKREYLCYFDKNYLLSYYVITDALLMADSRVKNMMIATWGRKPGSYTTLDGSTKETYNFIWYPIFYDMDTMLGLDNTGRARFNYYDEDTSPDLFNGDEVLWNFVRDALPGEVSTMYKKLEESKYLTAARMIPYFNNNQANMANEVFYNGDAHYKYVDTYREGYYDHLHTDDNGDPMYIAPGKSLRLYAAQGDRSLMRENFITNRIKFLRGKHESGDYQGTDRIEFRFYYPRDAVDERVVKSVAAVPPDTNFTFKSLQTCYAGVKVGQNGVVNNMRFDGEDTKTIEIDGSSANGTESYILGVSNLTDLGDLSNKYMQNLVFVSNDIRLKTLKLGNDHKDYYNPYWHDPQNPPKVALTGCTYLRDFDMTNCLTYKNTLDFTDCVQIEKISLIGSGVSGVTLPIGGVLQELRLPSTSNTFMIEGHTLLTPEKFTYGHYEYAANQERISDGGGRYVNDYSNLIAASVKNTPIDSYELAMNAPLERYCFQDIDWTITENNTRYCLRDPQITYYVYNSQKNEYEVYNGSYDYPEETVYTSVKGRYIKYSGSYPLPRYDTTKTYYTKDGDNYTPYTGSFPPPLDEEGNTTLLFEKCDMIVGGQLVQIPVLEYLLTRSTIGGIPTAEAVTGTITIDTACSASEFDIYQKYNAVYPNLTFKYNTTKVNLSKAYRIRFFNIEAEYKTADSLPYYEVLTDGSYNLTQLTSADGPAGKALGDPVKLPTNTNTYSFGNSWFNQYGTPIPTSSFKYTIPTEDTDYTPYFIENVRTYKIKFYDWDGQEYKTVDYTYNENVGKNAKTPLFMVRPNDADMGPELRYGFKGWISEKDYNNDTPVPTYYDEMNTNITYDMSWYAHYQSENVYETSTTMKCFKVETVEMEPFVIIEQYLDNSGNIGTKTQETITPGQKVCISIKPEYRNHIGGKITLPAKSGNQQITYVGDMTEMPNVTEVYFQNGSVYEGIRNDGHSGFESSNNISHIELPGTMRYLGQGAFMALGGLQGFTLPDGVEYIGDFCFNMASIGFETLPGSLRYIGVNACFNNNHTFSQIPWGITHIMADAFGLNNNLQVAHFGHTEGQEALAEENNLITIGNNAFANSGRNITEIYIYNSIKGLGDKCFYEYGKAGTTLIVHDQSNLINGENVGTFFGTRPVEFR